MWLVFAEAEATDCWLRNVLVFDPNPKDKVVCFCFVLLLFLFCFADVCLLDVTYRPESCTRTGAWVLGRCSACRSWTAQSCKSDSAACSLYRSRTDFSSCAVPGHCAARKPWSVRCGSPARAAPPPSSCRNRQTPPESNLHPAPNLTPNQTRRSESLSRARETSPV